MAQGMNGMLAAAFDQQQWTSGKVEEVQRTISAHGKAADEAERRIRAALRFPFMGETGTTTLTAFLADLARRAGIGIHVDERVLAEASIALDSPVRIDFDGVSSRAALDMVLDRLDLDWTVQNECLLVSTRDKVANVLITKVYPVRDLTTLRWPDGRRTVDYTAIIQTITDTLAPTTWDEVGGPGAIAVFASRGAIVVSQTREVHEEIENLLNALRQSRSDQPAFYRAESRTRHHVLHHHDRPPSPPPAAASYYVVTPTAAWSRPRLHE
ncbi:MAG TPA: hypothetical protein VMF30_15275 [Pirellulales bacterium]|nr:hypothetical protein [Pirellulales bacterium]